MKLKVKVKPKSRRNEVKLTDDGTLTICVSVPPVNGLANEKVVELLSEYLNKPKRSIRIIAGQRGKNKIVDVE